ncbi:MAG TPA: hypothetical protein VN451_11695, partial [Chitinophagaceae bacterium]|nr:hypothetical protein [Chitinophagaceae bacterium]
MPKILLLQIALVFSLLTKGQSYTDLSDQGYNGTISQIVSKFFSEISLRNGKWYVTDSLHPG